MLAGAVLDPRHPGEVELIAGQRVVGHEERIGPWHAEAAAFTRRRLFRLRRTVATAKHFRLPNGAAKVAMRSAFSMFQQALALQQQGNLEEAARAYDAVLASEPNHLDALLYYGVLRLSQSRAAEAETLLRKAVETSPDSAEAHGNLAAALQARGKRALAVDHYRRAIALCPDLIDARFGLAACLQALGRHEEAAACYQAILDVEPAHPEASFGLATLHAACKRPDEAIACYRAALAADPDFAEASYGLGSVLSEHGDYDEALRCFQHALDIDPCYDDACLGLGITLGRLKRYAEAVACCNAILARDQRHVAAHAELGRLAMAMDDDAGAIPHFDRALVLDPGNAGVMASKAAALLSLGQGARAIALCRDALARSPESAEVLHVLGMALGQVGKLKEGITASRRALAIDPYRPEICYTVTQNATVRPGDPVLASLKTLLSRVGSLPRTEQCSVYYAAAKAFTDLGDPEAGFRHLLTGSAIKRGLIEYDEAAAFGMLERTRAVFTADLIGARSNLGVASPLPIFVMGMPRSGTTLVEQILASHPDVFGAGELAIVPDTVARLVPRVGGLAFPESVWSMSEAELRGFGEAYVTALQALAPDAARIVDKGLGNFCFVGLIHLCLPGARIIRLIRDPVDTCLSNFSKLFTKGQHFSYELGELGRHYRAHEAMMDHWRDVLPQGVLLDVHYESLIDNFDVETRRIVAHCGLPWNDACLAFYKTRRQVRTASVNQVRTPIYRSSIGRWRPDESLIRPLLDGLAGN